MTGGTDFYVTKSGGVGYNGAVISTEGAGIYTSLEVGNGPTNNDMLDLNHADSPRTLTFSEPVENLFFAIVSMNANGYEFDQDFKVLSYADSALKSGYWGYTTSYTKTDNGDGTFGISTPPFQGVHNINEFHGVLAIENAVSSLTWTSQADENSNGFTIGTYGVAQTATASGNVLSNDDKGSANSTIYVSEVGGQSMAGNSVTLTLASGAIIKVGRDGNYLYDENGQFASLQAGQSVTENVIYTVMDSLGNADTTTLSIVVNGAYVPPPPPPVGQVYVIDNLVKDVSFEADLKNGTEGNPGGDVLDLQGLLESVNALSGDEFSNGYLRFFESDGDTQVQINADGGGNDYITAVTLTGVLLNESDTDHYLL